MKYRTRLAAVVVYLTIVAAGVVLMMFVNALLSL